MGEMELMGVMGMVGMEGLVGDKGLLVVPQTLNLRPLMPVGSPSSRDQGLHPQ